MAQPITLEPKTHGRATLKTTAGDIVMELWPREAPKAVRNFIQLALEGYYDGCQFHRVVPGLCVQTGDASNSGEGGDSIYEEGYFEDEITQRLRFNRRGLVAMANTGKKNTNLSQFFITLDRADALTGKNTIFGTIRGDTYFNVMAIAEGELQPGTERPVYPVVIKTIEIDDNPMPEQTVPRITAAEKRQQEKARREARKAAANRSKKKEGVKNKNLMSFEDEEEAPAPSTSATKLKSAHELLNDPHLSKEVKDDRGTSDVLRRLEKDDDSKSSSRATRESSSMREQGKSSIPISMDSAAFSTRIDDRSASPETSRKKKTKERNGSEPQGENDRIKAEIAKVQADLKRFTRRGSSEAEDSGAGKSNKGKEKAKHSGAALLAAERAKYAQGGRSIGKGSTGSTKGKRRRDEDEDIMDMLDGFRSKIRSAAPTTSAEADKADAEEPVDGYAGEILEGDDDDSGWMAHTLKFRKDATMDQHNIDEYEVIDPRTQIKTLEDAKRQEARLKRHSEQSGRLTAGASARAERDLRGRDNAGGRNYGRERH
ncbi:cyclophilin-like protein [Cystobasidium minutum MCA 4210]|uniref:cyclophilin-like protein n=1 Tax=Cystobasidium minutum MCA 4210 TaxID=1397322 RepID=UPI0034CD4519|eukprot:jgi/Rhomi1/212601/estExt_Genemark1.C_70094